MRRTVGQFEPLESRQLLTGGLIALGPQTDFNDQPYVEVELVDGQQGLGPYGSGFGLFPYNRVLLDTGANSALIVSDAAAELQAHGLTKAGDYREQGVAGYTPFNVSEPYQLNVTGSDGVTHTLPQTDTDVRILYDSAAELGGPAELGGIPGLIGMPAMVDRVTTLDLSHWKEIEDLFELEAMDVRFTDGPDALPPDAGHRYSIAVDNRVVFEAADGLPPGSPDDAPLPVWADVPFMTGVVGYQGQEQAGSFLLDTGAQMSVISPAMAFAIGLDESGDGDFFDEAVTTMQIGGVGGIIDAPVLLIDQLRLPTEQGVDLAWMGTGAEDDLGLEVIVLEIAPGIDGVVGVDLLTSGMRTYFDEITFEFLLEGAPYFDQIHFDFRDMDQGTGTVYFDLNPMYDVITAGVAGRHVFYNGSAFDGGDLAPGAADDVAIATDKQALLPGETATFANYTSYSRGINGIMVDVAGLPPEAVPTADDFEFYVGNSSDASTWTAGPDPSSVTVRRGAGVDGSDRITLTWDDHAIQQQWLQATVLSTANTGLLQDDVFYFGNAVAEGGDSAADAKVNATDMLLARNNPRNFLNPAPVDFRYDYDRDGKVNATDMLLARNNPTNFLNALTLITGPEPGEFLAPVPIPPPQGMSDALGWLAEYDGADSGKATAGKGESASPHNALLWDR